MSSETKADKIRKLLAENPTMKAGEVAKAISCNDAYVYLIKSQKKQKFVKKPEISEGQKILRTHITSESRKIAELEDEVQVLRGKISVLKNVIWYMQHGASI